MITTSYFAKLTRINNPVAITASKPRWYTGNIYKVLAPPTRLVLSYKDQEINEDEYTILYREFVLDKLDPKAVYDDIIEKFGDDATLLCYEKSTDFCHRHLVSEWLRQAGFDVRELDLSAR